MKTDTRRHQEHLEKIETLRIASIVDPVDAQLRALMVRNVNAMNKAAAEQNRPASFLYTHHLPRMRCAEAILNCRRVRRRAAMDRQFTSQHFAMHLNNASNWRRVGGQA